MSKRFKQIPFHFRDNKNRKEGLKNRGKHPSLVIGVTVDNKKLVNIGLTHSTHRGHHKNIEIHDPTNWKKKSYLRNDIRTDPKEKLRTVLHEYKLHPKDEAKVIALIEKYKKRIPTRR